MRITFVLFLAGVMFLQGICFCNEMVDPQLRILEERVNKILRKSDVDKRPEADDIFKLADLYLEKGMEDKAMNMYNEALKVDSWRYDYQMKHAELLVKNGSF